VEVAADELKGHVAVIVLGSVPLRSVDRPLQAAGATASIRSVRLVPVNRRRHQAVGRGHQRLHPFESDLARPSAATQNYGSSRIRGNSFTGHAYARLTCRAPSREVATSYSLGRQPQGSDARNLSSPGGAMSCSLRGPPANVTRVPTSPRWGFAGRVAKTLGLAPQATRHRPSRGEWLPAVA